MSAISGPDLGWQKAGGAVGCQLSQHRRKEGQEPTKEASSRNTQHRVGSRFHPGVSQYTCLLKEECGERKERQSRVWTHATGQKCKKARRKEQPAARCRQCWRWEGLDWGCPGEKDAPC